MPIEISLAAISAAVVLSASAARRDLHIPFWLTLAAFGCLIAATWLSAGVEFAGLASLVLTCLLIAEADRRHHLIPDLLVLALLLLSLAVPHHGGATTQVIGAFALGGTFLLIRQAGSAWRGAEALGWGDVKLAAAMGVVLGPIYGFAAVAIAGGATLLVMAVRSRTSAIATGAPFGIGLATATAAMAIVRAVIL